jgi:hypothetical protein
MNDVEQGSSSTLLPQKPHSHPLALNNWIGQWPLERDYRRISKMNVNLPYVVFLAFIIHHNIELGKDEVSPHDFLLKFLLHPRARGLWYFLESLENHHIIRLKDPGFGKRIQK